MVERERERERVSGVVLGSGGWMATPDRATSAFLLHHPHAPDALLLDAGTGLARICRQPELLGDAERLDIVLTHFHLDHVVGLTYLPALAGLDRPPQVTVWAPGRLLGNGASIDVLSTLVGAPYLSADLTDHARVEDLPAGDVSIGSWQMAFRRQPYHPGGSVAVRVDDTVAYCTDTAPDPDNPAFVRGVSLLLHEAWAPTEASPDHSSAAGAAEVAAAADVDHLVLSHIHPLNDHIGPLVDAARPIFPNTEVGYDGQALPGIDTG